MNRPEWMPTPREVIRSGLGSGIVWMLVTVAPLIGGVILAFLKTGVGISFVVFVVLEIGLVAAAYWTLTRHLQVRPTRARLIGLTCSLTALFAMSSAVWSIPLALITGRPLVFVVLFTVWTTVFVVALVVSGQWG